MMPGENEPLPNSYYEEGLKSYDDQIASLQQQLENAEEVDRQALETQLKKYRDIVRITKRTISMTPAQKALQNTAIPPSIS